MTTLSRATRAVSLLALLAALFAIPHAASVAAPARDGEAEVFLAAHNRVRARHCAGPLRWSEPLAQSARLWAKNLKQHGCALQHSGGAHGENLAAGTAGAIGAELAVDMWSAERKDFDFKRGGFSMKTGHFTQLVWRDTTQLGCARAACPAFEVVVCQYDPPGNVDDGSREHARYRDNVRSEGCAAAR